MRTALIRETIEAIATVWFTKWKEEILGWGYEPGEEDRQRYIRQVREGSLRRVPKDGEERV